MVPARSSHLILNREIRRLYIQNLCMQSLWQLIQKKGSLQYILNMFEFFPLLSLFCNFYEQKYFRKLYWISGSPSLIMSGNWKGESPKSLVTSEELTFPRTLNYDVMSNRSGFLKPPSLKYFISTYNYQANFHENYNEMEYLLT